MPNVEVQTPRWSMDEYHADDDYLNHSKLKIFFQDPPIFEGRFVTGEIPAPDPTDATLLGNAVHAALLEPSSLEETVAVIPRDVLAKNGAKNGNAWKAWAAEHEGMVCVKEDVPGQIERMRQEILANPETAGYFDGSEETETEVTVTWHDPETGLPLKARLDLLQRGAKKVGDVKVSAFPTSGFPRQAPKMWWHTQAALYRRAAYYLTGEMPIWEWVVVRSEAPYDTYLWTPSDEALMQSEQVLSRGLHDLRRAIDTGNWRDPHWGRRNELYLPKWASPWEGPIYD